MRNEESKNKVEIQRDKSRKTYNLNSRFLFKVVRNDDGNVWPNFCDGLTSRPEAPRPPLRHVRPFVGRFGIRIDGVYPVKKKPLFAEVVKRGFSKHQSCSVASPSEYFRPVPFGHARSNWQACLVGIRLDPEDSGAVLVQRIMAYDTSTVLAGYRYFGSQERAQEEYRRLKLDNKVFNTLDDLIAKGDPKEVNEVMARLRWVCKPSSQICIFSDTLEARLLAQVRARDLYCHLQDKKVEMPEGYEVPISFYLPSEEPPCRMYNREEQEADRRKAFQSKQGSLPLQPNEEKLKSRERALALILEVNEREVLENLEEFLAAVGKLTNSMSHAFFKMVLMKIKFDKFPIEKAGFWEKIFKIVHYDKSAKYLKFFRSKFPKYVSAIESGYVRAEMDVLHIPPERAPAILELLEKKENVVPNLEHRFSFAVCAGAIHLVKLIIASKKLCTLNIQIAPKITLLIEAIKRGHTDVVAELIKAGVSIQAGDNLGCNPLIWAASSGHIGILDLLIEAEADVHACDKNDQTALMWAISEGHIDVVRYLISKKVNIHAQNKRGETALTLARNLKSHAEIARMLQALRIDQEEKEKIHLPREEVVMSPEEKNRIEKIKELFLAGKIDLNKPLIQGYSPFCVAVYSGDLNIVKLFLENGAKVDQSDCMGFTPLHLAVGQRHLNIVELLLKCGAEPNRANKGGETALFRAVGNGDLSMVKLLLENGANPNLQNKKGKPPLWLFVPIEHLSIWKLLLEHGANPNLIIKENASLLDIANMVKGQKEMVQLLFINMVLHAANGKSGNVKLTTRIELLVHLLEEDKESKNSGKVISVLKKLRGIMSMINNQEDRIIESKEGGRQSPYFRDPKKKIPVDLAETLDRIAEMVVIVEKEFGKRTITDEIGIRLQEKLKKIVSLKFAKKSWLSGSLFITAAKKSDMNIEEIYQNIYQFLIR